MKCICRNKKTFKTCKMYSKYNSVFCRYHNNNNELIYKIFNKIFGNKTYISMNDIFNLYKYITNNINIIEYKEEKPGYLFIELLKNIPYKILLLISKKYLGEKKYKKQDLFNYLHDLNSNTYKINSTRNLGLFQDKYKYHLLSRGIDKNDIINTEDLFSCEDIVNIPNDRLFIIKDSNGTYGFDVIELEHFVSNCKDEDKEPYNPYTRKKICSNIIWKINKFMEYNNISRRKIEYNWQNNMHAFTDLSIELERRGFYNSPNWLNKMSKEDILKTTKYFRDFSTSIKASDKYFKDITDDDIVFNFCKDGIKMLKECKNDLYVLCCNFVKALAMCSNDFYENIPSWMSGLNTSSILSNVFSILGNDSFNDSNMSESFTFSEISNLGQTLNSPNNFLLYYYVEYM
uniref:Uncharacterized protein n=1 Tax=Virus NIOZ-UU159 TaxID=2763270 RepID=A0A7S9XHG3_9VIRU|nr:MAG: hypothetical protein NIOZUU159_00059 [Virus NIOZ-UU159]